MIIHKIADDYCIINDSQTCQMYFKKETDYYQVHELASIDQDAFELIRFIKQVIKWWDENIQEEVCSFILDERLCRVYCKLGFKKVATIIHRGKNEKTKIN